MFTECRTLDMCCARRVPDIEAIKPRTVGDNALVFVFDSGGVASEPPRRAVQEYVCAGIGFRLADARLQAFAALFAPPIFFNALRAVSREKLLSTKMRHGVPVRSVAIK